MNAINSALETQGPGDGDKTPAPSLSKLIQIAERHFTGAMAEAHSAYFEACYDSEDGRVPVIGTITTKPGLMVTATMAPVVRDFLNGHCDAPTQAFLDKWADYADYSESEIEDNSVGKPNNHVDLDDDDNDGRGPVGAKVMSLLIYSMGDSRMLPLFMDGHSPCSDSSDEENEGVDPRSVDYTPGCLTDFDSPLNHGTKQLTVGTASDSSKDDSISRAFQSSRAFRLMLLLNKLLNTRVWRERGSIVCESDGLDFGCINEKYSTTRYILDTRMQLVRKLFEIFKPALGVTVGRHSVLGGKPDMSMKIWSRNEHGESQHEYTSIADFAKPSLVYRAAGVLAFGDELKADYSKALKTHVRYAKKRAKKNMEHAAELLKDAHKHNLLKHTVHRAEDDGELVHEYMRDGEDLTEILKDCSLDYSLQALYSGLSKTARYATLNNCRNIVVTDGLTFIGAQLRDLKEVEPDLLEANFDSHYALDTTETASYAQLINYYVNTALENDRLRRLVEIILTAASEHYEGHKITSKRADSLRKLMKQGFTKSYKFHSTVYTKEYGLAESAKLFTKDRVPKIQQALDKFMQEYGDIAECGDYTSSDFGIISYFEVDQTSEEERSTSIYRTLRTSLVNFYGAKQEYASGNPCVLKVYDADDSSYLERELKAYQRISQLSTKDRRPFVELIAFGAIDLDGADPRLFMVTEYVEPITDIIRSEEEIEDELEEIETILESIGVYHNELHSFNDSWALVDGKWRIKVYDFDIATFDEERPYY